MMRSDYSFHTLEWWMNVLIDSGFRIEQIYEPAPDQDAIRKYPHIYDASIVAYFMIIRCRKD